MTTDQRICGFLSLELNINLGTDGYKKGREFDANILLEVWHYKKSYAIR
jgi:hypothetical protein